MKILIKYVIKLIVFCVNKVLFMEFLKEIEKLYGQYKKLDEIKLSYGRDLECYSTFDRNTILMVLTDILSEIEGVSFNYECYYHDPSWVSCDLSSNYYGPIIFDASSCDLGIGKFYKYFKDLTKLGKVITVVSPNSARKDLELKFYSITEEAKYDVFPNFSSFDYLKEFIDEVISYRFENKVEKISNSELERLKNQFILRKLGEKRDALINLMEGVSKKLESSENSVN